MPATGLHHVNIRVPFSELAGLRDFYCQLIGLAEGFRPLFGSVGHWLYAGNDPILHLSVRREGESMAGGAIDHIAFACRDLAAMRAKLDATGIAYRLAHVPQARQFQVFLRDPAGNGVELNFPESDGN
jgi:catechol 2,3-dioxygenase-like lactoylglutathione lyase family enzyme